MDMQMVGMEKLIQSDQACPRPAEVLAVELHCTKAHAGLGVKETHVKEDKKKKKKNTKKTRTKTKKNC